MSTEPERSPDPGLCARCRHAQRIDSPKGSTFWRCHHPALRKYPQLPVLECGGYEPEGERAP